MGGFQLIASLWVGLLARWVAVAELVVAELAAAELAVAEFAAAELAVAEFAVAELVVAELGVAELAVAVAQQVPLRGRAQSLQQAPLIQ